MYHAHFGLRKKSPSASTPDPRFFYRTPQHREAVATLFYAIHQRRGFVLLVGAPGLGKTSILFTLVRMLKGDAQIAYLANPYYDRSTVLDSILASLGLEPAGSPGRQPPAVLSVPVENASSRQELRRRSSMKPRTSTATPSKPSACCRTSKRLTESSSRSSWPASRASRETLQRPDCEQIRQRLNAISSPQTPEPR